MFCERTKEFLSSKTIPFEEKDITKDAAALEELQKRRLLTTPVILVNGDVIVGFDQNRLQELLGEQ
ncbi:MAG TPA: glutaredoxin domain-containing protein [Acidobacteriota bacterium]|nr:glutaredoxin domain-containing protein [Acidobacteriota bacterium]